MKQVAPDKPKTEKETCKRWHQFRISHKEYRYIMQGYNQENQSPAGVESGRQCKGQQEGLLQTSAEKSGRNVGVLLSWVMEKAEELFDLLAGEMGQWESRETQ